MGNFIACLSAGLAAATFVQAQTVYRCGNAYSDTPCANAQVVDVSDERSAEQRAAATEVVARDRRLAAELQRERRLLLASTKPAAAASLSGAPGTAAGAAAPRPKPQRKQRHRYTALQDDGFIAVVPGSGRKARKAAGP